MGTPYLKMSEAFIAILLLKSLPNKYSAIVQTTLASFESTKLACIYTIFSMEATWSTPAAQSSYSALTASYLTSQSKINNPCKSRDVKFSLRHFGHTDEQCKVRKFKEMEKDLAELKKEHPSKAEHAQVATTSQFSNYWESSFTCHKTITNKANIADTGSSSHIFQDKSWFEFLPHISPVSILVASTDGTITASQHGQVSMDNVKLNNILHSEKLPVIQSPSEIYVMRETWRYSNTQRDTSWIEMGELPCFSQGTPLLTGYGTRWAPFPVILPLCHVLTSLSLLNSGVRAWVI